MKKIWFIVGILWRNKELLEFIFDLVDVLKDGRITKTELNYILDKTREIIPS